MSSVNKVYSSNLKTPSAIPKPFTSTRAAIEGRRSSLKTHCLLLLSDLPASFVRHGGSGHSAVFAVAFDNPKETGSRSLMRRGISFEFGSQTISKPLCLSESACSERPVAERMLPRKNIYVQSLQSTPRETLFSSGSQARAICSIRAPCRLPRELEN